MSHDLYLTDRRNYCEHCRRCDTDALGETNVSYNHCWIWYDKFDTKSGFRAMYHVPIDTLIPRLEQLRKDLIFKAGGMPSHEMVDDKEHTSYGRKDYGEPAWSDNMIPTITKDENGRSKLAKDDGWATTYFNALRCIEDILKISKYNVQEHPNATWYGD